MKDLGDAPEKLAEAVREWYEQEKKASPLSDEAQAATKKLLGALRNFYDATGLYKGVDSFIPRILALAKDRGAVWMSVFYDDNREKVKEVEIWSIDGEAYKGVDLLEVIHRMENKIR